MKNDLVSDMKAYQNAKKVSKILGLSNGRLRKYSQILENNGYRFNKEDEKINYLEKDIIVLKKLIEMFNSDDNFSIEDAAREVVSMFADYKEEKDQPQDIPALELDIPEMQKEMDTKEKDIKEKDIKETDRKQKDIPPIKAKKSIKAAEIGTMEEKLDKAIEFILEREKIEAEFKKIIKEKDHIIAKLTLENEQHQKEKQIINLRDKLLLETIRKKQEEQKNGAEKRSFWPRKNKYKVK